MWHLRGRTAAMKRAAMWLAAVTLVLPTALSGQAHAQTEPPHSFKAGELVVEAPWARATPGGATVGGGYLKITNGGSEPDWLIGGSLPGATFVEVHEMRMENGIAKMRKLDAGLEIRPGQTVELKPGGYHLMFQGLSRGLKEGQSLKGTLTFQRAGAVEVEYRVAPIGATAPGHAHH